MGDDAYNPDDNDRDFDATDRFEADWSHSVGMQAHLYNYIQDYFGVLDSDDEVDVLNVDADTSMISQRWDWWGVDLVVEHPEARMPITCAYRGRRKRARGTTDFTLRNTSTGGVDSEVAKYREAYLSDAMLPRWTWFGIYPKTSARDMGFQHLYLFDTESFCRAWVDGGLYNDGVYSNHDGEGTSLMVFTVDDIRACDEDIIVEEWHPADNSDDRLSGVTSDY